MFEGINRNVILLGVVSLLNDVGSEMITPILPLFIVSLGGGALVVGLIGGLGDLIATGLKMPSGWWSDRIGKRKPFLLAGYSSSAIAKLVLSMATTWQHVAVLRPIERAGKGIRDAPRDALVADSVRKSVRGVAFGLQHGMDKTGAIIGSVLAVVVVSAIGTQYQTIILLSAGISLLALLPLIFVKDVRKKPVRSSLSIGLRKLPGRLRLYIIAAVMFGMGNFTYMLFILRSQSVTGSTLTAVGLYLLYNVVMAIGLVPAGRLADRFGRRNLVLIGWLLFAAVALGFSVGDSLDMLIVLFALYGLAYAMFEGNQRALVVDLAPPQLKGTALGTFYTATGISMFGGGIIAGILWQTIGPSTAFLFGAAAALGGIILMILTVPNNKP